MKLPYNPHNRRLLFAGSPRELHVFLNQQPRVLPMPPAPLPAPSRLFRLALKALPVILVLLVVLVAAVWFFLFGEERPERVRPELTPAQKARAFRLPHH